MKKTIALISALALGAASLSAQELSISTTFGWESKYIFRGVQLAEDIFTPSVDISYGGAYLGVWAALPAKHTDPNELDVYAGYSFAAGELLSIDLGATYYTYPDQEKDFFDDDTNSLEFYAGVAADVLLSPAFYVYYDIELENLTIEGSIGHSIAIGETSSIDLGAYAGWVDLDTAVIVSPTESFGDYVYYGVSADYVHSFNENVSAKVGVRWGGSDEDQIDLVAKDDRNTLWWGFSVSAGF